MSDTQQGQDNNRQHERDGDEQQVKRVRYEYDYNNLIVVLVGKFEVQFQVHKDTICGRSKFFQAAVSSDRWVEGQEKLVRLPEVSMDEFRMYVHWAYTGKISPEVYSQQSEIEQEMEQDAYYYAYILADILDDGELRTHVLDTIIAKSVD